MSFIEIRNLYKIFGADDDQNTANKVIQSLKNNVSKDEIMQSKGFAVALQDVTLSIEKGETFVVMGLSGSGKSTLIRCLNRLIEPTKGEIWLEDTNVLELADEELREYRRKTMSMVFQRFGLLPHRNILDNVAYGLEIRGIGKEERHEKAMQWIDTVGLKGWENSRPHELSGGMQQRVGLARALCTDPEILLMDEAFSALDPLIRREMQNELIDLQGKLQKTIIFITHDLDEALRLGDRIAILKDGLVVQIGTPEDILMDPADDYVQDFTQDVNRIRVLTASNAMYEPITVVDSRSGPRVAIEAMVKQGLSSVFVVDKERRLQGIVELDNVLAAARKKDNPVKSLETLLEKDVHTTNPDATLDELLPMATTTKFPIAVIDEKRRLLGVIPRVAVLSALQGTLEEEEDQYGRSYETNNNGLSTEEVIKQA